MGAAKSQIRKKSERFVGIPYHVASSNVFMNLEHREVKLLFDVLCQYNGSNNGSLSACHTLMKKRRWAKSSLHRTFRGLLEKGFLVVTYEGLKIRGRPTLVAITWRGIDDPVNGKQYEDYIQVSPVPLNYWCKHPDTWHSAWRNYLENLAPLT